MKVADKVGLKLSKKVNYYTILYNMGGLWVGLRWDLIIHTKVIYDTTKYV